MIETSEPLRVTNKEAGFNASRFLLIHRAVANGQKSRQAAAKKSLVIRNGFDSRTREYIATGEPKAR